MTATSAIRWRSFLLHKDGNRPDEYEDAFAGNPKYGRFAIADGASESSFAAEWAKLLVEGYVGAQEKQSTLDWLTPLPRRWAQHVDHLELDWFGEEKRQLGAFATFLGLSLKAALPGKESRWKAQAVGDCCLFQVRGDQLIATFPIDRPADFGNRPALLGSRSTAGQAAIMSRGKHKMGRWEHGDRFFMATDALGEWFLRRHQEHRKPWNSLLHRLAQPKPTETLTAYVDQLRGASELRNDDITLLVVDL